MTKLVSLTAENGSSNRTGIDRACFNLHSLPPRPLPLFSATAAIEGF